MVLLLMHQLLNALGPCSLILTEDLLFPPLLMNSNLNSLSSSFSFTHESVLTTLAILPLFKRKYTKFLYDIILLFM